MVQLAGAVQGNDCCTQLEVSGGQEDDVADDVADIAIAVGECVELKASRLRDTTASAAASRAMRRHRIVITAHHPEVPSR
jgi:hypothetical protein